MDTWVTLRDRGALFVVNHSGGKDSQATYLTVRNLIPDEQLIVVHAILHEVDWEGIPEHIENTVEHPVFYVAARKTFFDITDRLGRFPSASLRRCTSDLKREPIDTFIRRYLVEHPEYDNHVVQAIGLRKEESSSRAKMTPWTFYKRGAKNARVWYHWLPVHNMLEQDVFRTIQKAGQTPHWAYAAGMTRLSCCFCIMGSTRDLKTAARLKPDLYRKYRAYEEKYKFTLSGRRIYLDEIVQGG